MLSDLSTAETLRTVQSNLAFYPGGYGYQIRKGERGDSILQEGAQFLKKYRKDIDWVIEQFGSHGSADLELESTIVYVDREAARKAERLSVDQWAQRVRDVKPHFVEDYIRGKVAALGEQGLLKSCSNAATARG